MIRYIFIVILMIAAVLFGLLVRQDPGYMLLAIRGWTVEMPLWLGVILVFFAVWLVYSLFRILACFFGMPRKLKFWQSRRKLKKAERRTQRGLIALAEGNFAASERLLTQSALVVNNPLLNYLSAAKAAQARGAFEKRDQYLTLASKTNPDAEVAISLTQAELQIEKQQWEQALATLTHLKSVVPHHRYVLKLLTNIYLQLNDWNLLAQLWPSLKKYQVFSADELNQLLINIKVKQLQACKNNIDAKILWDDLPRALRHESAILASYVPYLLSDGKVEKAKKYLFENLKKDWNEKSLTLYASLPLPPADVLENLEYFLKYHSNDVTLLRLLGEVCAAQQLWGKARSYFSESLAVSPNKPAYLGLIDLDKQLGNRDGMLATYQTMTQL